MADYPFYDKQPGPERREKLNELYATWENAISNVIKGDSGWSPLVRAVTHLDKVVLELYDWTGGQGSKPTEVGYLGSAGYVSDISSATDFRGPLGLKGDAASVSVGTVTTTAPGTNATVANSGTSSNAVFDFEIPRGATGLKGDAATVSVGTVTTGAAGTQAVVTNSGTQNAATFDFTIPRGDKGEQGIQGVKGDQGLKGDKGDTGTAATISVGTVTTGAPGTPVQVVNSGTASAAVFDFTIPRGEDGAGSGDMTKVVYDSVGDGVVNAARVAPWTGITGKPVVISAGATSADARSVIDAVSSGELTAGLNTKVDKVAGKQLSTEDYTAAEKTKLAGIAAGANNYAHPTNHPASIITQDANNRFVTDAEKAAWNAKQATLVSGTNLKTINGESLLGGGDLVVGNGASISNYPYENRATLRTLEANAGDLVLVDGLGLYIFAAGSDEPDDDESCFATATGRWLLECPHWDVVSLWQLPDDAVRDEYDEDEPLRFASSFASKVLSGTATCAITSVATVSSASFTGTVTGASVGDRVIATPPAELGATAAETGRLSYHARVSAANTVTVMLTNGSAAAANTNAAIRAAWPITVIKS